MYVTHQIFLSLPTASLHWTARAAATFNFHTPVAQPSHTVVTHTKIPRTSVKRKSLLPCTYATHSILHYFNQVARRLCATFLDALVGPSSLVGSLVDANLSSI